MGDLKTFSIDCPNRIKYEDEWEFDNSLFSSVYQKAENYVNDIIQDNKKEDRKRKEGEKVETIYCNDENFYNVIPFLGERGMGKTSAMLSFALSLQKKDSCNNAKYGGTKFHLLPRIDVGMMVKGENLLDIVLANMWRTFENKMDGGCNKYDIKIEQVKSQFSDVKKWYQIYIDAMRDKEKVKITTTRELKELSRCLNLAESLKKLTESFLQYMQNDYDNSYLVITLDDLDVATENVYLIMEQIRLFLNLPHVIILVSADIGRLFLHYTKFFTEMLLPDRKYSNYSLLLGARETIPDEHISRYVEGYLAKTFPHNRRIYLPEVNLLYENEYEIKGKEELCLYHEKNVRKLEHKIIWKSTGIIWYPFGKKKDVLYSESLRKVVNDLNELVDITKSDKNGTSQLLLSWLARKIEEYARSKASYDFQRFVSELLGVDIEYLGDLLLEHDGGMSYNMPRNITISSLDTSESGGYGKVLADIYEVYKTDKFNEKCRLSLLYFSIMMCKMKQSQKHLNEFCNESIFRYVLKNGEIDSDKQDVSISPLRVESNPIPNKEEDKQRAEDIIKRDEFKIIFEPKKWDNDSILEEVKTQLSSIHSVMTTVMLCSNNKESLENLWQYEGKQENTVRESGSDELFDSGNIKPGFTLCKSYNGLKPSIDYLINNICQYRDFVGKFVSGLLKALKSASKINDNELQNNIVKMEGFYLKKYDRWKSKYEICSITDFLPMQSTEVMLHIADHLVRYSMPEESQNFMSVVVAQRIRFQLDAIVKELRKIDNYYGFKGKESYADRVQEIVATLKIFDS